jgi:putative phage-type endonuclease
MNRNLEFIDTRNMSFEDWLRYRKSGVGASETGAILGLSDYKSVLELFYEKIAEGIGYNVENIHTFMGKELEDKIAELWQYWDGSEESMIENRRADRIIRRCQRVRAYVRNPKYPWLFVSLDRKINKHAGKPEGALEIKTIMGYEAKKWEAEIPPYHVVQVQTQLLVCEFAYGELAILKDGRRFDVVPLEARKKIFNAIIEKTYDFWQRVEKARGIVNQQFEARRNFNQRAVNELAAQLVELEPPPDNSEAYADFLKKQFNVIKEGAIQGTLTDLEEAKKHAKFSQQIKQLNDKRRLHENRLKSAMRDGEKLDFGASGYVSWKPDVNGDRRFLNKIIL